MPPIGIESAHVVGFSMGGMVGFQLAVDVPEMVTSLVAVNCCPEGSMRTFNDGIECFRHIFLLPFNGMRNKGQNGVKPPEPASERKGPPQSVIQRMAVNNKHASPREQTEEFNAMLLEFLLKHSAQQATVR